MHIQQIFRMFMFLCFPKYSFLGLLRQTGLLQRRCLVWRFSLRSRSPQPGTCTLPDSVLLLKGAKLGKLGAPRYFLVCSFVRSLSVPLLDLSYVRSLA